MRPFLTNKLDVVDEEMRGNEKSGLATTLTTLARLAFIQGHYDKATKFHGQALAIGEALSGEPHTDMSLHELGSAAEQQGDLERAEHLYERVVRR